MTNASTVHRELVAAEVRAWMGRRRVTQTDLARALGKSQAYVSRRLTGEVPFDLDDILALATFLGVAVGTLLGDAATVGDPSRSPELTSPERAVSSVQALAA